MKPRSKASIIPISEIDFGTRYRADVGDVSELAASIQKAGLLNSIDVKYLGETRTTEKSYLLIAGRRRTAALESLGHTEIEADVWPSDMTEYELRYVELMENVQRENLTWQEEITLTRELQRLESEMNGKHVTLRELAETRGQSTAKVSQDIKLSKMLERVPELQKCKTKSDALKAVGRIEEKAIQKELAKRVDKRTAQSTPDKARQRLRAAYIVADFFEAIKKIQSNSINLIELDPDYGIEFGSSLGTRQNRHIKNIDYATVDPVGAVHFFQNVLQECYRVLAPTGWILIWHGIKNTNTIATLLEKTGYIISENRAPLIWVKQNKMGRVTNPHVTCTVDYEVCHYARKENACLPNPGPSSIFQHSTSRDASHPVEKPVSLMQEMYAKFADPGARVLIPFAGSGNGLIAAANLRMQPIGFDIQASYKDGYVLKIEEWSPPGAEQKEDST